MLDLYRSDRAVVPSVKGVVEVNFDIDRLASLASRDDTIVFVGSGVSASSGLPTWKQLLIRLTEYLSAMGKSPDLVLREIDNNDLLLAASYGFHQLSERERCTFLRQSLRIPGTTPSPLHCALARLPVSCFITTNYDGLFEQALQAERPAELFDIVTPLHQFEVASIVQSRSKGFLFKPHGDLGSCDSIVLTREDYRRMHGERRNVLEAMRTLLASRPVIFVGYGLRDPDFLLMNDMMTATFGVNPSEHFAIMPDVTENEIEYWDTSYGIRIVKYDTTTSPDGIPDHSALLKLIDEIGKQASAGRRRHAYRDSNSMLLSLARHARRLMSTIEKQDNVMPINLRREQNVALGSRFDIPYLITDPIDFLEENSDTIILEGPPGAGKTFLLQQTVFNLARKLEQACLADIAPTLQALKVPVIVYLRDYRDDVASMLNGALPADIQLDELLATGAGVLFIDGINEAPIYSLDGSRLQRDLTEFLKAAASCTTIIATRFAQELRDLELPVVSVDEIASDYVHDQLLNANVNLRSINSDMVFLLGRPLFYRAWQDGIIKLDSIGTIHDIYTQLINKLEANASDRFGDRVNYGDIFEQIAYTMIDSGDLSVSLAAIESALRSGLPNSIATTDFLNYAIAEGVLLATPRRRLAFFHHSVTEYFAAHYLAKIVLIDRSAIRRCLGRRDWDQSLLLTLGFMPTDIADETFNEILRADRMMALRALNYVPGSTRRWRQVLFNSFLSDPPSMSEDITFADDLPSLTITAADMRDLHLLAGRDTALGGAAAGLLWAMSDELRERYGKFLTSLTRGYNFLTWFARTISGLVDEEYCSSLIGALASLDVDAATEKMLRDGDEVYEYVGLIQANARLLRTMPDALLIANVSKFNSVLLEVISCSALEYSRSQEAMSFVENVIVRGDSHAVTALYFQLTFGKPADSIVPPPLNGVLDALVSCIEEKRSGSWALGDIKLLAEYCENFRHEVQSFRGAGGLLGALLHYAVGDIEMFWRRFGELCDSPDELAADAAVEALGHMDVSWKGREEIVIRLLETGRPEIALPVLDSILIARFGEFELACRLGEIGWWIDWLDKVDDGDLLADRLGEFLAKCTDRDSKAALIDAFNAGRSRSLLAYYVLPLVPNLSLSDLSEAAIDWLLAGLNSDRPFSFRGPLLGRLATEEFVDARLIPLLLGDPPAPFRANLIRCLQVAGEIHRKRYVNDDGFLLG